MLDARVKHAYLLTLTSIDTNSRLFDETCSAALELLNERRTQPRPSEPGAASGPADAEDSREDHHISRRMYAGHDMSSHEVVVRSLLEVLQEFHDASEGDRTVRLVLPPVFSRPKCMAGCYMLSCVFALL